MKEKETSVQNQSFLRNINQKTILKHLRREKLCCADLAKRMKLSNTAISKIVDNLVQKNIITRTDSSTQRNNLLEISNEAGVVMCVNLAGRDVTICLINLSGEIVEKALYHNGSKKITAQDMKNIVSLMKEVYTRSSKSLPLLTMCIGTPGKLDKKTGNFLLAPHFENYQEINLHNYFAQHFDCKILIYNDINLALEGERRYGSLLSGLHNALMIYIDIGVGSALMLSDRIYEGSNGYAGEIGYYLMDTRQTKTDYFGQDSSNNLNALSINGIKEVVQKHIDNGEQTLITSIKTTDNMTLENLLEAYNKGDALVNGIINECAMIWSKNIKNMTEFLDLDAILISGDIQKFGMGFISIIKKYLNDNVLFGSPKVSYSEFPDRATILGGMNFAIKSAMDILLASVEVDCTE